MMPGQANHLLQSTLFAVVAGMLTLLLRNNHARTRYWIWLTASMKFLIPFSLFVEIGHRLSWSSAPVIVQPRLAFVVGEISQPFVTTQPVYFNSPVSAPSILPTLLIAVWICGCAAVLIYWFLRWRRVAAILRSSVPVTLERELSALRRMDSKIGLMISPSQLEPGVFGILRPVLLLPSGIADYLNDDQLNAIFRHELCHVRRRDNLTASLHMLVEAIFWFHPLVWWIGSRLVEERERACDEDVVRLGSDPEVYAETILRICRLYLASPLVCAAGISGSDLGKRIEGIMKNPFLKSLGFGKKLMLAAMVVVAVGAPVAIGMLRAAPLAYFPANIAPVTQAAPAAAVQPAPPRVEFASATVRPESPYVTGMGIAGGPGTSNPGQLVYWGITPRRLLSRAYIGEIDAITGPDWLASEKYYIVAEVPAGTSLTQSNLMLRNLLAERFHLRVHRETRGFTGYALVVEGPPVKPMVFAGSERTISAPYPAPPLRGATYRAYGAAWLPGMDSEDNESRLIDRTGSPGIYDNLLDLSETNMGKRLLSDASSLFFQMFENRYHRSLKLEAVKNIPIDVLVVDRADKTPVEK